VESAIASAACGFNIKCTRIFRDKFGYICASDKGAVRLQRPSRSQAVMAHGAYAAADQTSALLDYITFQHDVKEQLHASGIGVDRFLISTQGTPYFMLGGDCFVAAYAQSGSNASFTDPAEFLEVVATIAKMHAAVTIKEEVPWFIKAADASKQLANLATLKRKLLRTGKFSEFDMLFLKGCDALIGHITKSADVADNPLDKSSFFCHNLLKEENVYSDDGNSGTVVITNFSECGRGHYLFDLAYLIKRCLKAQPAQVAPLGAVLDTYHKHHPAANFHEGDFHHILLYPDKFVKVTADYYSKKRSFAPKTYISRIEECLLANDEMKKYIG